MIWFGILAAFGLGFVAGILLLGNYAGILLQKRDEVLRIKEEERRFFSDWLTMAQERKSMADYISEKGYKKVAIYGMGLLGQRLCDELEATDITVKYAIDKKADEIQDIVEVIRPENFPGGVDAVIITPFCSFEDIKAELGNIADCPMVSIRDFRCPEMRIGA